VSTLLVPQPEISEVKEVPRSPVRPGKRHLWLWLAGLWLLSGVFIVSPDQQALVIRFGAVVAPRVLPGIHATLPWPIDSVRKLKVHQLRRTVIGGDLADSVLGRLQPISAEFLSGDENLLNVRVVAQYAVSEPRDFLFQAEDVDGLVRAAVESELAHRIAHTPVDDILTTEKTTVQNEVLQTAQRALNGYHVGVVLSSVNIEKSTPPAEAADAFRNVASARADAIRIVNQAEGYANSLIPRARGEGAQMIEQAQAYRKSKVNRASGDATRFNEIAAEYAKAPRVTATRAYLEAMEQILPQIKKMIVDSHGDLDLTIIGRDTRSDTTKGEMATR